MRFPKMISANHKLYCSPLPNPGESTTKELHRIELHRRLRPNMRVAIAAGSRGIAALPEALKAVVDYLKSHKARPFIVPAMGSHGGATAEGQVKVLASIGITPKSVGAPIRSNMKAVKIGETSSDIPVYLDSLASKADGIIVLNRIKEHTDFAAPLESGIMKMMAIGLGKHVGASALHARGIQRMSQTVTQVGRVMLSEANILCGIAILEDAYQNMSHIEALAPRDIEAGERRLLRRTKRHAPRLPFDEIDLLIVERIGKEISGTGMDPNVTGRYAVPVERPGRKTDCRRIVLLALSEETKGNALGMGMADLITRRLMNQLNMKSVYANVLTSGTFPFAKIPVIMETDKDAITAALTSGSLKPPQEVRVVRIKDTLHLDTLQISEGLLEEARKIASLEISSKLKLMRFDREGNLL